MIEFCYLGRVAYDQALRLQEELVELRRDDRIRNVLLLLEHPPVLTLGRHANRANVLASDELLAARGVTVHHINRGGDVTYHGPGQLVGYPIFDLRSMERPGGGRMGPVDFVREMEEILIRLCSAYGVRAGRIAGLTGVWVAGEGSTLEVSARKIGAIGIHVSRGITSHGFAFNVTTDLRDFNLINPCGITDRPVTSLEREARGLAHLPSLEDLANQAAQQFGSVFKQPVMALEGIEEFRRKAAARPERSNAFPGGEAPPAQDTPLQVPEEVRRLRGESSRPERA